MDNLREQVDMPNLIRAVILRALLVIAPQGRGRHRARRRTSKYPSLHGRRMQPVPAPEEPHALRLPEIRSPYGLMEPIDGCENVLVRPYLDLPGQESLRRCAPRHRLHRPVVVR
ncbi:hypothetical protein GCM10023237_43850 [Streptomyces coeruleoprunus]